MSISLRRTPSSRDVRKESRSFCRKFAAFVFIALILRLLLNLALGGIFDSFDALTSVGVITAALIASTIAKQGLKYTLVGTVTVTAIVYIGVQIIALI